MNSKYRSTVSNENLAYESGQALTVKENTHRVPKT